jgi:hypothetical protein
MQNPYEDQSAMHDYRIYERLITMSVILKEGIMQQVEYEDIYISRNSNNHYDHNNNNKDSSQQQYCRNQQHDQDHSEVRRYQARPLDSYNCHNDKQLQKKHKTGDANDSTKRSNMTDKNTDNIDCSTNSYHNKENTNMNLNDCLVADWAMAMIARTYDKINELPEVKTTYQSIVESLEQDNMRKGQM